jgi:hypothetical protein
MTRPYIYIRLGFFTPVFGIINMEVTRLEKAGSKTCPHLRLLLAYLACLKPRHVAPNKGPRANALMGRLLIRTRS